MSCKWDGQTYKVFGSTFPLDTRTRLPHDSLFKLDRDTTKPRLNINRVDNLDPGETGLYIGCNKGAGGRSCGAVLDSGSFLPGDEMYIAGLQIDPIPIKCEKSILGIRSGVLSSQRTDEFLAEGEK